MKKERRINEEINTNEEALADTVQERDGDKAQEDKTKKKKSGSVSTVILVLIMLIGLGVFLYPAVSDWWNSMHATRAIAGYVDAVADMSGQEKEDMINAAKAYNEKLPNGVNFNLTEEEYAECAHGHRHKSGAHRDCLHEEGVVGKDVAKHLLGFLVIGQGHGEVGKEDVSHNELREENKKRHHHEVVEKQECGFLGGARRNHGLYLLI